MMDLLEHWTTNRWAWWWTLGWTYELHSVLTALGVMKLKLGRDPPQTQFTLTQRHHCHNNESLSHSTSIPLVVNIIKIRYQRLD